jgi:hypothetical protein
MLQTSHASPIDIALGNSQRLAQGGYLVHEFVAVVIDGTTNSSGCTSDGSCRHAANSHNATSQLQAVYTASSNHAQLVHWTSNDDATSTNAKVLYHNLHLT